MGIPVGLAAETRSSAPPSLLQAVACGGNFALEDRVRRWSEELRVGEESAAQPMPRTSTAPVRGRGWIRQRRPGASAYLLYGARVTDIGAGPWDPSVHPS
ncbi:hypothetical protein ACKI1J_42760 [Streptomyces scabiei]|uniref:hypothetical protein n=1 Tax=Streptomyces scabiei TaxID=1930 RepID=UPI0038F7C751